MPNFGPLNPATGANRQTQQVQPKVFANPNKHPTGRNARPGCPKGICYAYWNGDKCNNAYCIWDHVGYSPRKAEMGGNDVCQADENEEGGQNGGNGTGKTGKKGKGKREYKMVQKGPTISTFGLTPTPEKEEEVEDEIMGPVSPTRADRGVVLLTHKPMYPEEKFQNVTISVPEIFEKAMRELKEGGSSLKHGMVIVPRELMNITQEVIGTLTPQHILQLKNLRNTQEDHLNLNEARRLQGAKNDAQKSNPKGKEEKDEMQDTDNATVMLMREMKNMMAMITQQKPPTNSLPNSQSGSQGSQQSNQSQEFQKSTKADLARASNAFGGTEANTTTIPQPNPQNNNPLNTNLNLNPNQQNNNVNANLNQNYPHNEFNPTLNTPNRKNVMSPKTVRYAKQAMGGTLTLQEERDEIEDSEFDRKLEELAQLQMQKNAQKAQNEAQTMNPTNTFIGKQQSDVGTMNSNLAELLQNRFQNSWMQLGITGFTNAVEKAWEHLQKQNRTRAFGMNLKKKESEEKQGTKMGFEDGAIPMIMAVPDAQLLDGFAKRMGFCRRAGLSGRVIAVLKLLKKKDIRITEERLYEEYTAQFEDYLAMSDEDQAIYIAQLQSIGNLSGSCSTAMSLGFGVICFIAQEECAEQDDIL